jgi:hypothetical protein
MRSQSFVFLFVDHATMNHVRTVTIGYDVQFH